MKAHLVVAPLSSKPTRNEKKDSTRQNLVSFALKLSAAKGFSALSIREVAVGAGITPAGFYRHFKSLEELGLVLVDEVGLSLRRLLRAARKKVLPGPGAIDVSIAAFLSFIQDNKNLFRLFLGERQGSSETFRRAIHTELDRFITELSVDLDRLQAELAQPLRNSSFTAEAIVAVAFTIGAEAIDMPKHKQEGLKLRLVEEIKIILRGSYLASPQGKKPQKFRKSRS